VRKVKPGVIELMLDVLQATGGEVVEPENTVSASEQRVDEMGTDEPGCAGNEPGS
jgi:hypothetical protein